MKPATKTLTRHKLDVLKITFLAGLLGFISIQIKDIMASSSLS
jgi:hypothetical protein